VPSLGYVTRASSRCLPAARSAGNRVEAADGASFVVFIFLGLSALFTKCVDCRAGTSVGSSQRLVES
jgi:hypothetical protein